MARNIALPWLSVLILSVGACGLAYGDRIAEPRRANKAVAETPAASPYTVDLIGEDGGTLSTYQHNGRFYVMGRVGARYSIRVSNPTAARIEALVSVDGLDVIDGKTANYASKRGYVVPPRGQVKIDGFRVSGSHVATFRFSSVKRSYAGRKGKARNVGVIGVAIFAEKPRPQVIVREPIRRPYDDRRANRPKYDAPAPPRGGDETGGFRGGLDDDKDISADRERAPDPSPARRRAPATRTSRKAPGHPARDRYRCCTKPKKTERPGLGTEFGERRYSAVTWTRFERAHPTRPTAMAELRYNDAQGLLALGIRLPNGVNRDEITIRETARPFPKNPSYSAPPSGWGVR